MTDRTALDGMSGSSALPVKQFSLGRMAGTRGAAAVASFVLFFAGWWALAELPATPSYLLPSPVEVLRTLVGLLTLTEPRTNLWEDILASLMRQLVGFAGAVIVAVPLGIACGYFQGWSRAIDRLVRMLYPIPTFSWIPLVLIWFGPGGQAITFMVFLAAFWPIYMQAYEGTRQLSSKYLWVASALGATPRSIGRSILLPGSLPFLINGLRLGYGEAWRLLVAAEILLASMGLGQLIQVSRAMLEVEKIMAGIAVIGVLGFVVERFVFDRLELATIRRWWRPQSAEGREL